MAVMDWTDWTPQERAVLVFVRDGNQLLLIHKKRGLGQGKVNGPGGRIEPGESEEQAAVRETQEETGITPLNLTQAAQLRFQFVDGYRLSASVFLAKDWTGSLTVTDEADPFWHSDTTLPWPSMWADDALWLPPVLSGRYVTADFVFDNELMREARVVIRERPPGSIAG